MARKRSGLDDMRMWWKGVKAAWSRGGGRPRSAAEKLRSKLAIRRQVSGLFLLAVASLGAVVSVLSCQTTPSEVPGPPAVAGKEPDIRVRVKTRAASVVVSSPAVVAVRSVNTAAGGTALKGPVTVTVSPRGFVTTDGAGSVREWGAGADLDVVAGTGDIDKAVMVMDGVAYPGRLTLRGKWREAGQFFDVVSSLPMETYIAGVLQKELYDGWPRQAYEAQAIAARSYATHERDRARRSGRVYDVESSTLDQAYGGMPTRVVAIEATRATKGMVLTTGATGGGRGVLRAYYSSCCGGRSASAAAIWPTTNGFEFNLAGPLQGGPRDCACQSAPVYSWEVVRKNDELVRRVRAWGREVGKRLNNLDRIKSIEPAGRNSAGRPNGYTITDVRGQTFRLSAEEMRLACNEGEGAGPAELPDIRSGPQLVKSNDLEFTVVPAPAGSVARGAPASSVGGDIRIRGHGYGHGVGLCQYCAKEFAGRGMDAPTMLRMFYPGAVVERSY